MKKYGRIIDFQSIIETGWHLGPGTLCCSAYTWTNISLRNRIQRNYKELKITAYMRSWGRLWTTRYEKTKNPTATSEESGAKAGYCSWPLHTAPPRGWADHISHPCGPTHASGPTLTRLRDHLTPLRERAREPVTCFCSLGLQPKSQ